MICERRHVINILHLSDLHFAPDTVATDWYFPLKRDLADELHCGHLDAVILSGDIANFATGAEYTKALEFVTRLAEDFRLERRQIAITPGNHDVNWEISRRAFRPARRGEVAARQVVKVFDEGNPKYVEVVEDEALYRSRFQPFAAFYDALTGDAYSLDQGRQYGIWIFREFEVLLLGLNSAYDLDHCRPSAASILPAALNLALDELRPPEERQRYDTYLKLGIWHHPVHSAENDRIQDAGFCEALAKQGFALAFHGHTHSLTSNQLTYEHGPGGRSIRLVSAGTFGAPTKELPHGTPWLYNYIQIDRDQVTVHTRYRQHAGAWRPYAIWEQGPDRDPLPRYIVPVPPRRATSKHRRVMVRTVAELDRHFSNEGFNREGYRIAVEAHIFNADGRVLLQTRGPACRDEVGNLEGIGGEVQAEHVNLIDVLLGHVREEIGDVDIAVDHLLEVRPVRFVETDGQAKDWFVLSYLCRLLRGRPKATDLARVAALDFFSLAELEALPEARISRSTSRARILYRAIFGNQPYYKVWQTAP